MLLAKYWNLGNDESLRFNVNVSHKSGRASRNKKVTIKTGGQDTFQQLNDKLKAKFSELQDTSMNIFWKDDENRDIDIEDEQRNLIMSYPSEVEGNSENVILKMMKLIQKVLQHLLIRSEGSESILGEIKNV